MWLYTAGYIFTVKYANKYHLSWIFAALGVDKQPLLDHYSILLSLILQTTTHASIYNAPKLIRTQMLPGGKCQYAEELTLIKS